MPTHSAVPGKNCGKEQAQGQMNAHGRLCIVPEPGVELCHVRHPLLTLSCPPHCLVYPELPVSPSAHFHWQCAPSFLLHSQVICFSVNCTPHLSFLLLPPNSFICHFPPHQICSFSTSRHFPGEALCVTLP